MGAFQIQNYVVGLKGTWKIANPTLEGDRAINCGCGKYAFKIRFSGSFMFFFQACPARQLCVIFMNKIDKIVDQFAQKLSVNGIAIAPSDEIDWIDSIVNRLPAKYPPTFMSLISRYIFDDFKIDNLCFFANRGDDDWYELSQAIFCDTVIFEITSSRGFLHFARPADGSYDPVCFDIRNRKKVDYPVVRLDHESILVSSEIEIKDSFYPSMLELMEQYIIG